MSLALSARGLAAAGLHTAAFVLPLGLVAPAALVEPRVVAFLTLTAVFAFSEAISQRGDDHPGPVGSREALAAGLSVLALFALAVATRSSTGGWPGAAAGSAVAICGIRLRTKAMRALGDGFVSDVRAAPSDALVTSGPYATRRHPSETGALAIALGACLLLGSAPALAAWTLALLPLTLWRIGREDEQLRSLFGSAWIGYAARVRRL